MENHTSLMFYVVGWITFDHVLQDIIFFSSSHLLTHHIQSDYTTFFGDRENDLKMFETVGTSVAMGNANDKVKSVATYTTLSNEEDGIVHGMKYVVNDLL